MKKYSFLSDFNNLKINLNKVMHLISNDKVKKIKISSEYSIFNKDFDNCKLVITKNGMYIDYSALINFLMIKYIVFKDMDLNELIQLLQRCHSKKKLEEIGGPLYDFYLNNLESYRLPSADKLAIEKKMAKKRNDYVASLEGQLKKGNISEGQKKAIKAKIGHAPKRFPESLVKEQIESSEFMYFINQVLNDLRLINSFTTRAICPDEIADSIDINRLRLQLNSTIMYTAKNSDKQDFINKAVSFISCYIEDCYSGALGHISKSYLDELHYFVSSYANTDGVRLIKKEN